MDHVPYDFLDKIFSRLDHDTINDINYESFASPVWNEVVRVYRKKIQVFFLDVILTNNGFKCEINDLDVPATRFTSVADMQRLDQRYTRILEIALIEKDSLLPDVGSTSATQFPALLDYLAGFQLNRFMMATPIKTETEKELMKVLEEFEKRGITAVHMDLVCCDTVVEMIGNIGSREGWRKLSLDGGGASNLKEDLLAFVCRPQFTGLRTRYACFEPEDIRKVVDYSNSLENPWKKSKIKMRPFYFDGRDDTEIVEHWMEAFAEWMVCEDYEAEYPVFEDHGVKVHTIVTFSLCEVVIRFNAKE